MHISYENRNKLKNIDLHDDVFIGFNYDYQNRRIIMRTTDSGGWHNSERTVIFNNPIWFSVQACDFWGRGNAIMYLDIESEFPEFNKIRKEKQAIPEEFSFSYINCDTIYLPLEILINSGAVIQLLCESVDYFESTESLELTL